MRHPLLSRSSFTASSLLLLDAASSLVVERLACGSSLCWLQYVSLLEHLRVKLLAGAREHFFDILACACTGLETLVNSLTFGEFNGPVEGNFSLILEFTLVSNEVNSHILGGVLLNLLEPAPQVVECLVTCDIVGEEHAVRPAVEYPCDRLEGLLASLKHVSFLVIHNFPAVLTVSQI